MVRLFQTKKQAARARVEPGIHLPPCLFICACPDIAIVNCDVVALPEGVTVAGLKEHTAPAGKPEHAKLTAESKPLSGVTVRIAIPPVPELTVSALCEIFNVKLGEGISMT